MRKQGDEMNYIQRITVGAAQNKSISVKAGDKIRFAFYDGPLRIAYDEAELADNRNYYLVGSILGGQDFTWDMDYNGLLYFRWDNVATSGDVYMNTTRIDTHYNSD